MYNKPNYNKMLPVLANNTEISDVLVLRPLNSLGHLSEILLKHLLVTDGFSLTRSSSGYCLLFKLSGRMNKLASSSIWTIHLLMILFTQFSLIFRWHMLFLLKFLISMSKWTTISKPACTCLFPVFTHLKVFMNLLAYLCFILAFIRSATWCLSRIRWLSLSLGCYIELIKTIWMLKIFKWILAVAYWYNFSTFIVLEGSHEFTYWFWIEPISEGETLGVSYRCLISKVNYE